jgi:DNA-binding NtrC family response regulator
MEDVRARLTALAALPWHVRIEGPSGSGKGLAAAMLHRLSLRHGPFIECDVNEMAEGLAIEDLRGHARGAYTGAVTDRAGVFEAAHGGTLFIDEIATASLSTQSGLLKLVERGPVKRLGECRGRQVDVRIIFATNADLEELVKLGRFRADLLYRMGWLIVRMPALCEHREDIPEIAEIILNRLARESGRDYPKLTRAAWDRLIAADWPGNVRQLEGALKDYIAFGTLSDLVRRPGRNPSEWEGELDDVLQRHEGKVAAAARELRVSRKALYKQLKRHQ